MIFEKPREEELSRAITRLNLIACRAANGTPPPRTEHIVVRKLVEDIDHPQASGSRSATSRPRRPQRFSRLRPLLWWAAVEVSRQGNLTPTQRQLSLQLADNSRLDAVHLLRRQLTTLLDPTTPVDRDWFQALSLVTARAKGLMTQQTGRKSETTPRRFVLGEAKLAAS
jgi:hypothetical protein